MAGFAILFDQKEPVAAQKQAFTDFVTAVAHYKSLDEAETFVARPHCLAAKLNSASALHREVIEDEATGSWLLAAGTVIDTAAVHPQGDLRRLLEDYLQQGAEVVKRLDGHFALAIYDGRRDSLLLVSDPFGVVSLFYGQQGSQFLVSTSALAIAQAVRAKPSELGVRYFLMIGNVFGEMTLWQDINRMPPAVRLEITRQAVEKSTYWAIEFDPTINRLPLPAAVTSVVDILAEASRRSLAREGKTWLSLTGGFDSRTMAMVIHHCRLPFKSYCHGPPESSDVRLATVISREMGWDYEYFPLPESWGVERARWLERTLGQSDAHLGVLKTSRIIREQTLKANQYDVSLWGFGGEIYRGYYWKQEFFNVGASPQVNYERLFGYRLKTSLGWPLLQNSPEWTGTVRNELETQLKRIAEKHPDWLNTVKLDLIGTHLEGTVHAGAHISAVLGLQRAVSPFYLKDGISHVISINHKWRVYNRLFRLMLEQTTPKLAQIETADGGPALPMRPTNFYKFTPYWYQESKKLLWSAGYKFLGVELWDKNRNVGSSYPLARWRRETLAELEKEDLLAPAAMRSLNLYDLEQLQSFLEQAQRDDFGHEGLLSRVITIEMAMRAVGTSI